MVNYNYTVINNLVESNAQQNKIAQETLNESLRTQREEAKRNQERVDKIM